LGFKNFSGKEILKNNFTWAGFASSFRKLWAVREFCGVCEMCLQIGWVFSQRFLL